MILTAFRQLEQLSLLTFRFQHDRPALRGLVLQHIHDIGLWNGPAEYFRLDILSSTLASNLTAATAPKHTCYWSSRTNILHPILTEDHEDILEWQGITGLELGREATWDVHQILT